MTKLVFLQGFISATYYLIDLTCFCESFFERPIEKNCFDDEAHNLFKLNSEFIVDVESLAQISMTGYGDQVAWEAPSIGMS